MNVSLLPEETLISTAKGVLNTDGFEAFIELIKRKQSAQLRRAMSVVEPHEIYRSQGRVHAYDAILTLVQEIKVA